MSNVIEFKKPEMATSTTYFMHYEDNAGVTQKIELTGDERFTTVCPWSDCAKEVVLDFEEFISIMQDVGLYGSMVFCDECAKKWRETHGDG